MSTEKPCEPCRLTQAAKTLRQQPTLTARLARFAGRVADLLENEGHALHAVREHQQAGDTDYTQENQARTRQLLAIADTVLGTEQTS